MTFSIWVLVTFSPPHVPYIVLLQHDDSIDSCSNVVSLGKQLALLISLYAFISQ